MKPLAVFSTLAVVCAGGLLALSYQGWHDEPSAVTTMAASQKPAEPATASGSSSSGEQQVSGSANQQPEQSQTAAATQTGQSDAEQPETTQQPQQGSDQPASAAPSFDIVRIEGDGSAVLAGRAEPGTAVSAMIDGQPAGEAVANERGEWVIIPPSTIKPGAHELTLSQQGKDGTVVKSDQSVALTVPENPNEKPLIVASEAGKPSRVLQKPAAQASQGSSAQTAEAKPEPEEAQTQVAAADPQPEGEGTSAQSSPETAPQKREDATAASTQPAAPEKPKPGAQQLSVDVVDYDDAGRTTFAGKAQPNARVRIYVSDRFTGEAQADEAGSWSLAPTREIAAGTHTLRADQVQQSGKVVQRIELPFKRESAARIAALQQQRASQPSGASGTETTEAEAKPEAAPSTSTAPAAERSTAAQTQQTAPAQGGTGQSQQAQTSTASGEAQSGTQQQSGTSGTGAQTSGNTGETQTAATTSQGAGAQPDQPQGPGRVVIQPGNNLWQISRVIYGKGVQYTVIYEANKSQIRNPNLIYPGQIFETPGSHAPESIDPDCKKPLAECEGGDPAQ